MQPELRSFYKDNASSLKLKETSMPGMQPLYYRNYITYR